MQIFVAILVLNLAALTFGEHNRISRIEKMEFAGWKECYKLNNSEAEIIVVPAIGRAVSFKKVNGPNVFRLYDQNAGKTRCETDKFIQFGGLYTWLAPQNHWSLTPQQETADLSFCPPFDALPHSVTDVNTAKNSVTICYRDPLNYRLAMEKTYSLPDKGAKLIYKVKVSNIGDAPVRWSIWNTAAVAPEGILIFYAPNELSDFQFFVRPDQSRAVYKNNLVFSNSYALISLDKMQINGEKAYVKPGGSFLIQYTSGYWLVRQFQQPRPTDLFTDNYSQIELWLDKKSGLVETEIISPDIMLKPKGTYSWEESFSILPSSGQYADLDEKLVNEALSKIKQ